MKTLNSILILLLTVFLVFTPAAVSAQSSTPPEAPAQEATLQGPDVYPISLLGYTDQILNGPYSFARIRFRLPDTWALNSGASIQLHIRNILTSTSGMTENELVQATGATLEVHFNSEWVTTLVLDWVGDKTVTIPVPADALATKTGQYTLSFYLDAGIDCNFDHQTTVVILSDSVLDLQHDFVTPAVDSDLASQADLSAKQHPGIASLFACHCPGTGSIPSGHRRSGSTRSGRTAGSLDCERRVWIPHQRKSGFKYRSGQPVYT